MAVLSDILSILDRWSEWKRLREAPGRVDELERRMAAVEALACAPAAARCERCCKGVMRAVADVPDQSPFGAIGVMQRRRQCDACGFEDFVLR